MWISNSSPKFIMNMNEAYSHQKQLKNQAEWRITPFCHAPTVVERGEEEGEEAAAVVSSSSQVSRLLPEDLAGVSTALAFEKWVALVRKRSGTYRSSGFPHRHPKLDPRTPSATSSSPPARESDVSSVNSEQAPETSLWERLGNAATLDIESVDFPWGALSSLHHTEHTSSSEQSEDEMNRALEVTVNSGGVVFFALFGSPEPDDAPARERAAVIKITSSRMATQSERLGYEFAKRLGVQTPQTRIIHNSSSEWQRIKDAADKARGMTTSVSDDAGEITCSELVEALELSRCLLLMNYVHGSPLLESSNAFSSRQAAEQTAAALGRVLLLDLVIRNEDRLPCRQLGWRGNPANLLFSDKSALSKNVGAAEELFDREHGGCCPRAIRNLQKDRRANSADNRVCSDPPGDVESPKKMRNKGTDSATKSCGFQVVAIDSGVPRRPPAGKRAKDQAYYPKLVELLLNSAEYSSNLLFELSGGRLGLPSADDDGSTNCSSSRSASEVAAVVNGFRGGFRAALRDLQGFHLFLLTLYQKLDVLLRAFLTLNSKCSGETEREDHGTPELPVHAAGRGPGDTTDSELQRATPKSSSPGSRWSFDSASPLSRENWGGRYFRGNGEPRSLRLTMKLRDFNKFAKVDAELSKEMEQWNETFRTEVIRLCQENYFNTGFFEGGDGNFVVDAYELKVRLEHILERTALISDAANTEKPSSITSSMFIGGALAARSVYTLQYLGISHILCLCSNEIGQSDSQYPDNFEYKNFSISDNDDEDISGLFEEAFDFIDGIEQKGGKVLVHCFEGRSRSATVVLAYMMQRKNMTLLDAWDLLKKVHRRAQPNDGFARILVEVDRKVHGAVSMQWQHRRPTMKVCPICGKNAGLSSSSLKLHLQKAHRSISSGSVDSAMTMEIQRALHGLRVGRDGFR
ncbi:unnamed protein product [Spirodela intermedia]|uniref:Uncharacterized protein n=1 Tax=Spirodela intermedia TaxID=51605 RepID=A0A7I8IAA7_SPIIN|nr:unnamed protein product [Spirodela intermedia]CAA6654343.1 unnamed protein product [Spirodela intermedia]